MDGKRREKERERRRKKKRRNIMKRFSKSLYIKFLWINASGGNNLVTFIRSRFKIKNQNVPKYHLFFLVMENLMSPAFTLLHYP